MSDITRQKTIDYLYYLKTHYPKNLIIPEYIDYAIASLETDEVYQLEYEQPEFCADCISRKAAIQGLGECPYAWTDSDFEIQQIQDWKSTKEMLENLPSVLPKTTKNDLGVDVPDNNVGNIDCISRADAIGSIAVECSAEKLDIDYAKFLMLRRAIKALPTITPQEPRKGEWLRMSDLSEQEDDRYKCSRCGNVIHHKNKMDLYTFNSWCGRCGSDNGRHINYEVEE